MMSDVPTIVIRFDIEKTGADHHGVTCWKVFWQAINPGQVGLATTLWEGETAATFCGEEHVFCIAVQSLDDSAIAEIRDALSKSESFRLVCASPMFAEGATCAAEPLFDACRVDVASSLFSDAGMPNCRALG